MTNRESPAEPRFSWRRSGEQNLAIAWTASLGVGTFAIWQADHVDFQSLALPIGVLMAYVVYGLRTRDKNFVKFADSVYFTGFLWTLVALIKTLGSRGSVSQVMALFGQALAATASGMFLRLLLLQFHETARDVEDEAEQDVLVRVRRLADELDRASAVVGGLAPAIRELDRGLKDAYRDALSGALPELRAGVAALVSTTSKGVEELASAFSAGSVEMKGALASIKRQSKGLATELESTLPRVAASAGGLAHALELSAESVQRGIRGSVDSAAVATAQLHASMEGLGTAYREAGGTVGHLDEKLKGLVGTVDALAVAVASQKQSLDSMREEVVRLTDAQIGVVAEQLAKAEGAVRAAEAEGHQLGAAIREIIDFLHARLRK